MKQFATAAVTAVTLVSCSIGIKAPAPDWDGTTEPDCTNSNALVYADGLLGGALIGVGAVGARVSLDAQERGETSTGGDVVAITGLGLGAVLIISALIGEAKYKRCESAYAQWRIGGAIGKASRHNRPKDDTDKEPPPDDRVEVPRLRRSQIVETSSGVDGVYIAATPSGAAGWTLTVTNNTPAVMTVHWDESTFVASTSEGAGRLIRGETRKIDSANQQPATPVAPGSTLRQSVVVEKMIDAEELEAEIAKKRLRSPDVVQRIAKTRASRNALLVGGTLHVTVQVADGKKTWSGIVKASGPVFCFGDSCASTLEACNEIRASGLGPDGVGAPCVESE